LLCTAALAILTLACSATKRDAAANAAACSALSKIVSDNEQLFVTQAQTIRAQHVMMQDYDREMISAITERRAALQATKLTELSVSDEVAGCSGKELDDLRRRAQEEMANLRDYLRDFNLALKSDPAGVYIDAP
jgi:hypothetical protein